MKVFVITQGIYSDHSIRAVSLDADEAERICALINANDYYDPCEIEVYDTDEIKVDSAEKVLERFWIVVGYKTGKIYCCSSGTLVLGEYNDIKVKRRGWQSESTIHIVATFPKGTTQTHAKKVMLDRIAKFKAERAGL